MLGQQGIAERAQRPMGLYATVTDAHNNSPSLIKLCTTCLQNFTVLQ